MQGKLGRGVFKD